MVNSTEGEFAFCGFRQCVLGGKKQRVLGGENQGVLDGGL